MTQKKIVLLIIIVVSFTIQACSLFEPMVGLGTGAGLVR